MEHTQTHTPAYDIDTDAFAYVCVCCICYEVAYLMLSYSHSHSQSRKARTMSRAAHLRSEQVPVAVVQSNPAKSQTPCSHPGRMWRNFTSYPLVHPANPLAPLRHIGTKKDLRWLATVTATATGNWQRRDSSRPDKKLNHIWTSAAATIRGLHDEVMALTASDCAPLALLFTMPCPV